MPKSRFQKRYAECKKRGTCYSCGKKLSKDYSSSKRPCCDGCREHDNAVARDYKNRMKIAGRCRTCGKEKVDGRAGRCRQCYEQDRNAQHLYGQRLKLQVLTHYSDNLPPFCSCCGESEIILLTLDHVKGGGNAHRREVGFGPAFYRHIVKKMFPSGYQVLCYSCNIGKHRNGGVCPAADAHLHLKFLRNIHPHTKGRILRHDGGEVVFPVPYRAEQPGDEIPLPVSPIPISVRHWPEVPPAPPSAKQRGTAVPLDWPALSFHGVELVVSHNVILVKEVALFNQWRATWLKTHRGKWALVKCLPGGSAHVNDGNFFDTPEAAYKAGLTAYGNVPMLIRQVLETDPVVNIPTVFSVGEAEPSLRDLMRDEIRAQDVATLDATGMQSGETRTGKVSFPARPAKPGSSD